MTSIVDGNVCKMKYYFTVVRQYDKKELLYIWRTVYYIMFIGI